MGREVWRMPKGFQHPLNETWWGFLLPAIVCQSCKGEGTKCSACEGEGEVYPKVQPPGYALEDYHFGHVEAIERRYGWQMWETTSEGSPISPVCDSPEALARWLADNKASSFGHMTATYEQWLSMIQSTGYAVSMVLDADGMRSGVELTAEQAAKEEKVTE